MSSDPAGIAGQYAEATAGRRAGSNALADGASGRNYYVRQGDRTIAVEALHHEDFGGRTVEEFYAYDEIDGASANTPNDMEREDTSQLFFYEGPEKTSLVFIHDEPATDDGGEVRFEFDALPEGGHWAVRDDPGETSYDRSDVHWRWFSCCTDGGAYGGGFEDAFWFELTPEFRDGITDWVVVDGSGGDLTRHSLDLDEPISFASAAKGVETSQVTETSVAVEGSAGVSAGGPSGADAATDGQSTSVDIVLTPPGEVCFVTELDGGGFCIDPFADSPGEAGGQEVLSLGPRECSGTPSRTPPLVSADITYFEVESPDGPVKTELRLWVGIETRGAPCIWIGETTSGACHRLGLCDEINNLATSTDSLLDAAEDLAIDILDRFEDAVPELDVPPWVQALVVAILAVVLLIVVAVAIFGVEVVVAVGLGLTIAGAAASAVTS